MIFLTKRKVRISLLCLLLSISLTGCSMLKSDQEKFDELTIKFKQDFKAANTREEKVQIVETYKNTVPKDFKVQAQNTIDNISAMDGMDKYKDAKFRSTGDAKLGHYSK